MHLAPALLVLTLWLSGTCTAGAAAQGQAPASDLAAALDRLVHLQGRSARDLWAEKIAVQGTVAEWLHAIERHRPWRAAPEPADGEPGVHHGMVALDRVDTKSVPVSWFLPDGQPPKGGWPVILALHGAGGSAKGELSRWVGVAGKAGWAVLAPQDPGANRGFRAGDAGERAVPLAALRWMRLQLPCATGRVVVTGTSRGGHLAWDLGLRHPDRALGLAPFIGGPRLGPAGGQNNTRYLEQLVATPVMDLQGEGDDPLLLRNLRLAFDKLKEFGAVHAVLDVQADLGHSYRFGAVPWSDWLDGLGESASQDSLRVRLVAAPDPDPVWGIQILAVDGGKVAPEPKLQIRQRKWQRMTPEQQAVWIDGKVREATARLTMELEGPGKLRFKQTGVAAFRYLVRQSDLPEGSLSSPEEPFRIVLRGKRRHRFKVTPDAAVLLRYYAERLDPRDLPIAAVEVRGL